MTFLYLNSDTMGEGDPELGRNLMFVFLSELAESGAGIDVIGCVNSGIRLTTEGSDVIDILKTFERRGTRIATCGTCLDFHNLRDKLRVGEVGSMKKTVEIMLEADRIIRPA